MSAIREASVEGNHALPSRNTSRCSSEVVAGNSGSLAANHQLLEANSRLLKSNAAMLSANHDVLLQIAARLGVM